VSSLPGRLCAAIPPRVACALAALVLVAAVASVRAPDARADNVSDVTCNSVDDRIYIALQASDYDQWLWYRLWKFNPATRQWDWFFDAPTYYVQWNWNQVGVIGGGGGPGTIRGGFLTYIQVRDPGVYYLATQVIYTTNGVFAGSRYEWVTDYSSVDYVLRDRRFCYIS
jgi:hypothetical protein